MQHYKEWNLDGWVGMFTDIYGARNSDLRDTDLWLHVVEEAGELAEGLRKIRIADKEFRDGIVDTYAWLCSFAGRYGSFDDMVWGKYPSKCIYCRQNICTCNGEREQNGATGRPGNLNEWQRTLYVIYGQGNNERSLDEIAFHLFEEIGEVAKALRKKDKKEIVEEVADSFAWLIAVVNRHDPEIRIDDMVYNRYSDKCPHCNMKPCRC